MVVRISEAASEKRKRGRPKLFNDHIQNGGTFVAPDVRTVRGKWDVYYRQRALHYLTEPFDPRLVWLLDPVEMAKGEPHCWKPGILTELGRIENVEELKDVALQICELKPRTTKAAIAMIRRWRLGKEPPHNYLTFVVQLEKFLNNYLMIHPSASEGLIVRGLREVAELIEDSEKE